MKINKRSRKRMWLYVIGGLLLVSVIGVIALFALRTFSPERYENTDTNLSPPTDEQVEAGRDIKEDSLQPIPEKTSPETENTATGAPPTSVVLTAVTKTDTVVQIRSLIETVTRSGTCKLTLTKDQLRVAKTAEVQALASSSTCQGFDIPLNELSPGTWQIFLEVSIEGNSASTIGSIDI